MAEFKPRTRPLDLGDVLTLCEDDEYATLDLLIDTTQGGVHVGLHEDDARWLRDQITEWLDR